MLRSKQQIQSPPRPQRSGSKQLAENLSKDELVRRLKKIAQELSDADQGENLEDYSGTVTVLAKPFIVKHADKDVRLYAACCFAQVLRIYAPEAPYHTSELRSIFDLIISQLEGLKDAKGDKGTSYDMRLFHLLESLAVVKTLILCVQLEFTDLILKIFRIIFDNVREQHSMKVKNFMLDIMATLLSETESVPQDLLDVILENVVNPKKASNRAAYELASTLIERTATWLEPHIQQFFNNALFFDKASESVLKHSLYDVLYELYKICPGILLSVLPQLEFKLKSVDEQERITVVALLAKMFSDEESTLAQSHKSLWLCFLGRFVDISTEVRVLCTKHAKDFFLHHAELVGEISDKLLQRQRDPDERVRMEVVNTICEAASENINVVSAKLFDIVTERLRDRKPHIRTDTMMSLGRLYKKMTAADVNNNDRKKVSWIPTKILHCYYNNSNEDRIHVERVFLGCLVPISLASKGRMKKLFALHQTLDEPGVKAFNHMLKTQASLRSDLNDVLSLWEEHQKTNSQDSRKLLSGKISTISSVLPEPGKSQEHLKSLVKMLTDKKLLNLLKICFGSEHDCSKVTKAVSEVVVKFGAKNPMYETIKAILDRAAPLLIDTSAGKELVTLVMKCVNDELFDDIDISSEENSDIDEISASGRKALDLLLTCVSVFPTEFKFPLIFEHLLMYLKKEEVLVNYALRILTYIGQDLQEVDSTLYSHYQPALSHFFTKGSPKQVKLAARIVSKIVTNSSTIFTRILENHTESLDFGSRSLLTTLSCMSEIALHEPAVFEPYHTAVIRDFVVKEILMNDRGKKSSRSGALWCDEDELSKEVKAKIICLKILVNWLRGMPDCDRNRVKPVIDMLNKAIQTNGDINEGGCLRRSEMAHIKLAAACGLLKLAQVSIYHEFLEMKYVLNLKSIIKDPCSQVRVKFAKKLSKGLDSLKLPLEYLALFSFYGREVSNDIKQQVKQMLLRNIKIRNEYLKQLRTSSEHSTIVLPEYALPYLIYMLSHFPNKDYTEADFLKEIKAYLWFLMESILARGENFSFMKKLAENIKQTEDANADENKNDTNHAMYVVCDIVIGIIMSLLKTRVFLLKDYPADIVLPRKLYTPLGKGKVNNKSYLPKDFDFSPVKKPSSSIFPKLTPSKNISVTSSSSSEKKKTPADKSSTRVSEKTKGKKVQKSILSMMEKSDEKSDEEMSDVEEPPATKETAKKRPTREDNKKEAKFTKVSPRKKLSTAKDRSTEKKKSLATNSTAESSPTRVPKRQLGAAETQSSSEKRAKKSTSAAIMKEKPTRSSPRRNQRSAVERNTRNLDQVKRTIDKDDYSDVLSKSPMDKRAKDSLGKVPVNGTSKSTTKDNQTDGTIPSPTKSPVKKRKVVEEDQNPMEQQSTLVIKRKRKRR